MKKNKVILVLILSFSVLCVRAQTTTSSPYSQFGIGQLQRSAGVVQTGMGNLSNGIRLDNAINSQNPASYNSLYYTTFEVGVFGASTQMISDAGIAYRNNATLNYIKLGFPISKKWGASFGLVPVSGVGYESKVKTTTADTPVTQIFSGSGGLSRFYVGTAAEIFKGLSVGVNVNYLFGTINKAKANEFPDSLNFQSVERTNSTYVGSIILSYGLQYKRTLNNGQVSTLGLNGNPNTSINGTRNSLSLRYVRGNLGNQVIVDTINKSVDEKGKIIFPAINSFGFSLAKNNKWLLGADVGFGAWSNLEVYGQNQNLRNTFDLAIGGSFTPQYNAVGNYFKTIDYRLGFNYLQSYVEINNEEINQISASFGMGLPLPKTASRVNLAVEVGQRGTTNSGLIQEEFIVFHAGFNFCDRWFIKRKYD